MRMERGTYKMEQDKHRKLMKKLIDDGMSFNEFLDRITHLYLEDKYELKK
ncbi:MAG: hypothetical protein ACOCQN_04670 [Halanaerobiaceae bacterium]